MQGERGGGFEKALLTKKVSLPNTIFGVLLTARLCYGES
ncbi:hypothetical protein GJV44_00489 [Candidatus Vallotia cooleyia]|nr:hypothetical protein GJV44_00489 [Candidatus Vallotia cooleyia]